MEKQIIKKGFSTIQQNKKLVELFKANANVGTENLVGRVPLLKVHSVGRSSTNILADGREPEDGHFYYAPQQRDLGDSINCHILTVSKGFRTEGLKNQKNVFNQIMGGLIIDDGKYLPFLMYFSGKKLRFLWDFGKEAAEWTRAKPIPIPMFALTVNLSTKKEKTDYGFIWVVEFKILKDNNKMPLVIGNESLFSSVREKVRDVVKMIDQIIEVKQLPDEENGEVQEKEVEKEEDEAVISEEEAKELEKNEEKVDPKDIPF